MDNTLTVKKIVDICNGKLVCGDENIKCTSFSKDTRTIQKGDTYIGIKGEKFDGNLFYKDAIKNGASVCILEKKSVEDIDLKENVSIILVNDSIEALKKLALYKRNNSNAYFVGVTGSVGKTSTRDMIYSVLNEEYKTLKTEGNYNNNIGLPLTLLRLKDEDAAVIEMGMNAPFEIDYLSKITKPNIGVITNVGPAHIGNLGSRENILKAKLEIRNGIIKDGILIINNDNDLLHKYYEKNKEGIITIGINNRSDFSAVNIKEYESYSKFEVVYQNNTYSVTCPVPGLSFIYNSLIAFATGALLKIDFDKIIKGIKSFSLTKNRLETFTIKNNITVINDAYNASVDSMKSSLEILKNKNAKRKIAILGSMLELGNYSKELHIEVGKSVVSNNIDFLITVGIDAEYIARGAIKSGMDKMNVFIFKDNLEVISFIKDFIKGEDAILVKASNGMHFNEIVEELKKF